MSGAKMPWAGLHVVDGPHGLWRDGRAIARVVAGDTIDADRGLLYVFARTDEAREVLARAIAALPDLIAALLLSPGRDARCVNHQHECDDRECFPCRARAALKKAGAL